MPFVFGGVVQKILTANGERPLRLLSEESNASYFTVLRCRHFVVRERRDFECEEARFGAPAHPLKAQRFFTVRQGEHSLHVYHSIYV